MSQQAPATAKRAVKQCFPADCEIRSGGEVVAHVKYDDAVIRVVRRDLAVTRVIPADRDAEWRLAELARLWRNALKRRQLI